ncbi:hypothetical protein SEA_UNPHAZED_28 [Microbacterium phage Unphazed]|nr:hypothetical protein SEA_UNPHAZED_28 [Microbacterium phage Unphazed]
MDEDDWKAYYEQRLEDADKPIKNPLPVWEPLPYFWASAPLHVMSIATHACVFCGQAPIWSTYEDYLDHWRENEWEGDPYHVPTPRYHYNLQDSLCLA